MLNAREDARVSERERKRLTEEIRLPRVSIPLVFPLACHQLLRVGGTHSTRAGVVSENWMTSGFLNLSEMSAKRKDIEKNMFCLPKFKVFTEVKEKLYCD